MEERGAQATTTAFIHARGDPGEEERRRGEEERRRQEEEMRRQEEERKQHEEERRRRDTEERSRRREVEETWGASQIASSSPSSAFQSSW
jgi:hypothetical protein